MFISSVNSAEGQDLLPACCLWEPGTAVVWHAGRVVRGSRRGLIFSTVAVCYFVGNRTHFCSRTIDHKCFTPLPPVFVCLGTFLLNGSTVVSVWLHKHCKSFLVLVTFLYSSSKCLWVFCSAYQVIIKRTKLGYKIRILLGISWLRLYLMKGGVWSGFRS